ncbi:UDP-galactopyranose mutase [Reichenbachiella faecimaris]|uniref:UDP-galactopyranose mutase n=1 Tax=Reichenbachiella faecimaris TaxID=692418 RepID=A0A1W2GMF8_REIFA|nr:FAD-dependent oxidoreductase [Reichenbachiella faecimaris]SMD37744.1 UDP-galactopyranose mutase [Reichenbachiella faecimaris]
MKVIIIGAGPAGLSCAHELSKSGVETELFEATEFVGGMSRSFDLWGQRVDLGPHRFFSKEKRINHFFAEVLEGEYTTVNRLTRIYYKNRFFQYPLKFSNVLLNLNPFTIIRILWDYLIQRINPIKNPTTFEAWVTNRFGNKLYEIFFKSYSEKLWGIPCSKIDADWAAQRIKTLSLIGAVWSAIKGNAGNKHKTLVDEFSYPKHGTGLLYEKCAQQIQNNGGTIHLNAPVKRVLINESNRTQGIELADGTRVDADFVISTMPLTTLIKGIENVPTEIKNAASQLYFRNTILVYLEVDGIDLFKDNWIYVHSPDVKHGRITNFRNWCPTLYGNKKTSILCLEFWAFEEDDVWSMPDENLAKVAISELEKLKLVPSSMGILNSKVIKIPKCYPVYETGYQKPLKMLENYADCIDQLIPIGRYGSFKYNNQDHSILMGLLAAENILGNNSTNLWEINTDTEYQEEGEIKDILNQ